jgi:phosphoglycerate dehydrogenase-like enzyme
MPPRVAFCAPYLPVRVDMMLELARPDLELEILPPELSQSEKALRCAHHEIIIIGKRVSMETLLACDKLKFIQLMSAGYDGYDVGALQKRGVQIASNAVAIAPSVAEHTIMLMLAVKRRLVENWLSVQRGHWDAKIKRDEIAELSGSTIGIVGLGYIGQEVAKRLKGWDVNLLYFDAVVAPPDVERALDTRRVMLGELLKESDVITLHIPLTAGTHHLIGGVELRMMKPTAILINTSRGSIVDERALCEALINGWIAGAGLDVLEVEPPSPDSPLLAMENVVMTPHVGGSSIQRVKRSTEFALANVKRVLKGLPPLGLVTAA